jgi:hypothetical protein
MAPVLAITDMVARARRDDSLLLTPMERFLNLIVAGPNRIPFSTKESRNESRQALAYSQGEEGMVTKVAAQ